MSGLYMLPNGLEVFHHSKAETEQFYRDIFGQGVYVQHGITLRPGACVIDVGANIGLFVLFVALRCPGARIYACEPAPPTVEILHANISRHNLDACVLACGIGARPGAATLTFYPHSSGMSSFYADKEEEKQALRHVLQNEARLGFSAVQPVAERMDDFLDARLRTQTYECRIRTVSEIVHEYAIERIDLLKIDAQKSEADVLEGIREKDWPKVQQISMEVHDLEGRLSLLQRTLIARGFEVAIEQEDLYAGSSMYNLYGVRKRAGKQAGLCDGAPPDDIETRVRMQHAARRKMEQRRARGGEQ